MAEETENQILLLCDQMIDVKLIEKSLSCEKFKIHQVDKTRDALTLLDYKEMDVVLCDLDTQSHKGLECFNLIYREFPSIPIILLKHDLLEGEDDLSILSIGKGAQDFLWKSQIGNGFLEQSIFFAIERSFFLQEAKASEKKRNKFLAQFSHEIRTPLNAVMGMACLLNDRIEDVEQKKMLETIQGGAERILHIMNNISEISKIDSYQIEVNKEPVFIRDFIRSLVMDFSKETNGQIIFADIVSAKVPKVIMLDRNKVQQVICHLLGNAFKFTTSGFITVEININQKNNLYIGIEDTGCGISEENKKKLFQPFSQIKHDKESFRGTGLGLIRCKKITELLGGECGVNSHRGKGSLFWFTIQLNDAHQEHDVYLNNRKIYLKGEPKHPRFCIIEKQLKALGAKVKSIQLENDHHNKEDIFIYNDDDSGTYSGVIDIEKIYMHHLQSQMLLFESMNPKVMEILENPIASEMKETIMDKVIVVDDEMVNRKIMVKILKSLHIEALTAANGEEALTIYGDHQVDVIFMDCFMPIMDGYEATQKLRDLGCESKIIALTAHALDENKQKCLESGMDGFLTKPVSIQDIRSVVKNVMSS